MLFACTITSFSLQSLHVVTLVLSTLGLVPFQVLLKMCLVNGSRSSISCSALNWGLQDGPQLPLGFLVRRTCFTTKKKREMQNIFFWSYICQINSLWYFQLSLADQLATALVCLYDLATTLLAGLALREENYMYISKDNLCVLCCSFPRKTIIPLSCFMWNFYRDF
jgi:hypothetical protein